MPRKVSYLMGHKKCGIKVGDKVKVKRKAESYESGWVYPWMPEMDFAVGRIGVVECDSVVKSTYKEGGFALAFRPTKSKTDPSGFAFPYFVLEKIK